MTKHNWENVITIGEIFEILSPCRYTCLNCGDQGILIIYINKNKSEIAGTTNYCEEYMLKSVLQ